MVRYSFDVRLSHPFLPAGLSRRTVYSCHKYDDVEERKNRVAMHLKTESDQKHELAREFGVEVAASSRSSASCATRGVATDGCRSDGQVTTVRGRATLRSMSKTHTTKFPLNVWKRNSDGVSFGFPIAADAWGTEVIPGLNFDDWDFRGTLPLGLPVQVIRQVPQNGVDAKIAGLELRTAHWAVQGYTWIEDRG